MGWAERAGSFSSTPPSSIPAVAPYLKCHFSLSRPLLRCLLCGLLQADPASTLTYSIHQIRHELCLPPHCTGSQPGHILGVLQDSQKRVTELPPKNPILTALVTHSPLLRKPTAYSHICLRPLGQQNTVWLRFRSDVMSRNGSGRVGTVCSILYFTSSI